MHLLLANPWGRRFLLLGLGAITGLGQAPFGIWPATLFGLAGILFLAIGAKIKWNAFGTGWWAALGYFLLSFRWIVEPFLVDAPQYGWMAPFALLLMSGGVALFWGLAFATANQANKHSIVTAVAALSLAEIARSYLFTGFPWALLGHVWIDTPFAQLAAVIGPHGLTMLTIVLAAAVSQIAQKRWVFSLVPIAAVAFWFLPTPKDSAVSQDRPLIRIVQPNVPQNEKWDPVRKAVHFQRLLEMSRPSTSELDLVVWPETALAQLLEFAQPSLDQISETLGATPLITGIQRRASGDVYHNSLLLVGREGRVDALYDKEHLVPFGEYFPGGEIAARLGLVGFASSEGAGFTAGTTSHSLHIPGVGTARPLICYEGIFAEEISTQGERPTFLILITNDAWFGKSAGPQQHLVQARFRAIEQGLPMIRAANTGISAMIGPRGEILQSRALDQSGFLDAYLPEPRPMTIYARLGDMPAIAVSLLLLLTGIALNRRKSV